MTLSLDELILGVSDVPAAHAFYTSALSSAATADMSIDLHGAGRLALQPLETLAANASTGLVTSGFRGYIVSYIVSQPNEVEALLDAAVRGGAKVLKPAKGGFFGGFSASYQAPDGTIWKLASASKKNSGAGGAPPIPSECGVILGVSKPKESGEFYKALGMATDHDYGNKFIDFKFNAGACRLGLMPRQDLAKDVGVSPEGSGFSAGVLGCHLTSREDVDALLEQVASAGGTVVGQASANSTGAYEGFFSDPDGFVWNIVAP